MRSLAAWLVVAVAAVGAGGCVPPRTATPPEPTVAPAGDEAAAVAPAAAAPAAVAVKKPETVEALSVSGSLDDRARAAELLEAACAKGEAARCAQLADALMDGLVIEIDWVRAGTLREQLCNQNHARACYSLAGQHVSGDGVPESAKRANELYLKACELGEPDACGWAASRLKRPELAQRAFDLDRAACESGVIDRCVSSEHTRKADGVTGEVPAEAWKRALAALERECEGGDGERCGQLAYAHERGFGGLVQNMERVRALREIACTLGDAYWCSAVAAAHEKGDGVPLDAPKALPLRKRACELGDGESCAELARVKADPVASLALYRRGCDLGDSTSCYRAQELVSGEGDRPADPVVEAAVWARLCGLGYADGCIGRAEAAETAKDLTVALRFYARACMFHDVWRGCAKELSLLNQACRAGDRASCEAAKARTSALPPAKRELVRVACCDDRAQPPASPTAAVLRLAIGLRDNDRAAVISALHPRGTTVHDREGGTRALRAKDLELHTLPPLMRFEPGNLVCAAVVKKVATCKASDGGTYTVSAVGKRFYVSAIDERD